MSGPRPGRVDRVDGPGVAVAADPRAALDAAAVRHALEEVPDPELPVVSIVDLGMVGSVEVTPRSVEVALLPTFVGCPALEVIRAAVVERLERLAPEAKVKVHASFTEPWTSDRITPAGRERLRAAGIAPPTPASRSGPVSLLLLETPVPCPSCGSSRTRLENAFGPTLCRTIRYCTDCRQPFEQLKTV